MWFIYYYTNGRVCFSYRIIVKQTPTLQKTNRKKVKRNAMSIHTMLRNVQFNQGNWENREGT